jgi:hypothetical protein
MEDLTKRLNNLLKTKAILYYEYSNIVTNSNIAINGSLINVLTEVVDTNYILTQVQLNKIIAQISFRQNGGPVPFIVSTNDNHKKIIKYIFTNNNIKESDIIKICKNRHILYNGTYLLDCLFENKYNFTNLEFQELLRWGHTHDYYDINNYDTLHNNVIFIMCRSMGQNDTTYNKCLELIKKNTEPFNIKYIDTLLTVSPYSRYVNKLLPPILNLLFKNCAVGTVDINEIFKLLVDKEKTSYSVTGKIFLDYTINNFGYSDIFVEYMFTHIIKNLTSSYYVFDLTNKGYKITLDNINFMLKHYEHITNTHECNNAAYRNKNIRVIDLCDMFKIKPDIETLNIACSRQYINSVEMLVDTYNIIPEKQTLDACIPTLNYEIINKILKFKLTPDDETFYKIKSSYIYYCKITNDKVIKVLNLLIMHGFNIHHKHIKYLLNNKFYFDDLDKIGIPYDDKLYHLCYLNNLFPEEYVGKFKIDKNVMDMHTICRNKNLEYDTLMKFLNDNNIKLDRYALEYLITYNPNVGNSIMRQYNCIPSLLSVYRNKVPQKMLTEIIKQNNIKSGHMFEQYEMKAY